MREHGGVPDGESTDQIVRRWTYAPPAWRMFEALVDERDKWLTPNPGEQSPAVVEARRPDRVVLRPWVDEIVEEVEVVLAPNGAGSQLTVIALTSVVVPEERQRVRHRIGVLFGESLREWVDHALTA